MPIQTSISYKRVYIRIHRALYRGKDRKYCGYQGSRNPALAAPGAKDLSTWGCLRLTPCPTLRWLHISLGYNWAFSTSPAYRVQNGQVRSVYQPPSSRADRFKSQFKFLWGRGWSGTQPNAWRSLGNKCSLEAWIPACGSYLSKVWKESTGLQYLQQATGSDTPLIPLLPTVGFLRETQCLPGDPFCAWDGVFRAGMGYADSPDPLCHRVIETVILSKWGNFCGQLQSKWKGKNGREEKNMSRFWFN